MKVLRSILLAATVMAGQINAGPKQEGSLKIERSKDTAPSATASTNSLAPLLPTPLVHFRFDGDVRNEGKGTAKFLMDKPRFENNAMYVEGKYMENDILCMTPELISHATLPVISNLCTLKTCR